MKKIIGIFLVVLLSTSISSPAAARDFVPTGVDPRFEDKVAFTVQDLRNGPNFLSLLLKPWNQQDGGSPQNNWCRSFVTDSCKLEPGHDVQAHAILPACKGSEANCVVGLRLAASGSEPVLATRISGFEEGFSYDSIEGLGTPVGSVPSLWRAEGLPNSEGSNLYVVAVNVSFLVQGGSRVIYGGLSAAVYPVVELTGARYKPAEIQSRVIAGKTVWNSDNGEQGSNDGCMLTTTGKCWARTEFAPSVRAEVSMRVPSEIKGWLHGRLQDPDISITPVDRNQNLVRVNAAPVEVPMMYAELTQSTLDAETLKLFESPFSSGGFNGQRQWMKFPSFESRSRALISKYAEAVGNKAVAVYTSWQFNSIGGQQGNQGCFGARDGLIGLVTTNAMAYDQNPPAFKDGFLEYSVAGLHYLPDGKKALGVYDLVIDSEVARCLYGFSNAPVSAKVSVLTADGESVVASTQVSEKDGWLKLAAYGFTFSEKKITVKVTQPSTAKLAKFKQGISKLSSLQKQQLDLFATKASGASKITCSSTYFGSKNKVAAIAQAKAACDFVIAKNPDVVVEIKTVVVKRASDALRVFLKSA